MAFTADQLLSFQIAWRLGGALSLVGNLAIMASFLAFKRQQTLMNKLVVFMTIADIVASVSFITGNSTFNNQTYCNFQGFGIEISMLSYFCWQASVATHCMLVATAGKPLAQLSKFIKYYHVVSWGLPVIVSIVLYCLQFVNIPGIPRGAPVWQSATFFCWISNNYATMRMVFFYGPLWATFVYAVVCYVYTWRRLTRSRNMFGRSGGGGGGGSEDDNSCNPPSATSTQPQQQSVIISSTGANSSLSVMARANSQTQAQQQLKRGHQRFIMKCTCYMLAFVVNWSFATINRSQNIIAPQSPIYALYLLHSIFSPLQGVFNAAIYFYFMIQSHNKASNNNNNAKKAHLTSSASNKEVSTSTSPGLLHPDMASRSASTNNRSSHHATSNINKNNSAITLESQPVEIEE